MAHQLRRDTNLAERLQIAADSNPLRSARAGDHRNATMAALDEILRRCFGAAYVIDKQIIQRPGSGLLRIGSNPDDGDLPFEKWAQIARCEMKEYADHTVDPSFEQAVEALSFFSWKPIGIVD